MLAGLHEGLNFLEFAVIAERDALALVDSPFVVRLFYSFQSRDDIYLVRVL